MNFEPDFQPLIDFVENEKYDFDETMASMMYMCDDEGTYYYKDKNSREYLKLDKYGKRR